MEPTSALLLVSNIVQLRASFLISRLSAASLNVHGAPHEVVNSVAGARERSSHYLLIRRAFLLAE